MIIEKNKHRLEGLQLLQREIPTYFDPKELIDDPKITVLTASDSIGVAGVFVGVVAGRSDVVDIVMALSDRVKGKGGWFFKAMLAFLKSEGRFSVVMLSVANENTHTINLARRLNPIKEFQLKHAVGFMYRI